MTENQKNTTNGDEATNEVSPPDHHFTVDSGLKNIIGQELITNDFVAIYELVKNCLDAHATKVDLIVRGNAIIIADNGKGMVVNETNDEIESKWLTVAYSAKKLGVEDENLKDDFKKIIANKKKRAFGGNKGVGRFSCDRLGENLTLYTKTPSESYYNQLDVDWGDFEDNELVKFYNVGHSRANNQPLSSFIKQHVKNANTILVISNLRNEWGYKKLQSLKKEPAQLINPFEKNQDIKIRITASHFEDLDKEEEVKFRRVNGLVSNNIYESIGLSTTKIEVNFNDGHVHSKLIDRGALIYEIREAVEFKHISDVPIKIDLSFLNRAAKIRFTRFMGITALEFGHVFLFKNGYRVMPYGVRGNDILGYDDRKSQGQRRYLGSRDLLGQINILNNTPLLVEPSSRDGGLIKNAAYSELEEFFKEYALKRLEAYVVGITFKDITDKDKEDSSGIRKESARIGVIKLINKLTKSYNLEILNYHSEIVSIIDEKSRDFSSTIKNLKHIASVSQNANLLDQIKSAEAKYTALEKAKKEAESAEAEARRVAREETEKAQAALEAQRKAEEELQSEKKISLFLKSLTEVDVEDIIGLNHQVVYDATNVKNTVNDAIQRVTLDNEYFNGSVALQILQSISLSNQKILLASQFATRANFQHQSDGITQDMVAYLRDYIRVSVRPNVLNIDVSIEVLPELEFIRTFKPLELSIIVDNFVSNAQKARAPKITFKLDVKEEKLNITVTDTGDGLGSEVDISRIFDLGYSGTKGSGIGLYHIRSTLEELNGTIRLVKTSNNEAKFLVEIGDEN